MMINVSNSNDKDLYIDLIQYLYEVKIVQGPKCVDSYLFWHKPIKEYLIQKQKDRLYKYDDICKKALQQ